jgi:glutathione S-transferase
MMKLLSSPLSPYGRKVKITARVKGLLDQIRIEQADTNAPNNKTLKKENPLSKIPVLILDNGTQLYDSHVICEYLDSLKPSPKLFPLAGAERFNTLTLGALGDGILDAALLLVYERRFRPEDKWVTSWMERQQDKIDEALAHLEANPPLWGVAPDCGHITIACALGYLD